MILLNKALKYVDDVIDGKEVTTKEVKKQCLIFKNEYKTLQYEKDFEYVFSKEKLKVVNNLLKLFNFSTGFVEGNVLNGLAGFQALFICAIFWLKKERGYK